MKIEGTFVVRAPREVVWELLNDPETLARALPGCRNLVPTGPGCYEATMTAGIAAIKGTYKGSVTIHDANPPESYTLEIEGRGSGGFVCGKAAISLVEQSGLTQVNASGEAQVGGLIAAVGQRLAGAAAKMMLADFFQRLDEEAIKKGRVATEPGCGAEPHVS